MLSKYRVYHYDKMDSATVTAGDCAVLIGAQSGLFPDMGSRVQGEMGGLWAGEKKVCDGFFFAIDDVPLLCADACETNPAATAFHYRMQKEQLHIVRRQMIPDGVPGCIIEMTIENLRPAARMVEISFTVRTDILTVAAALGEDGMEMGRDVGEYDEATQAFYARDSRNPWHAVWGAEAQCRALQADLPATVYGFGNTQGKGINGRLFYRVRVGAQAQTTIRLFVAGGFASRSRAEEALLMLRENAQALCEAKEERLALRMRDSEATLPDALLERCFNWTKIYSDYLTRRLPRGGVALSCDLPEHPALFGEGWAQALCTLLPLGGAQQVQHTLRTLVSISENAQLAPGRLARSVSLSGQVTQVGGVKESAQFVRLVAQTLRWTGDREFAQDMLPMAGLCISYLRRSTHDFEDVRTDIAEDVRAALCAQADILRMVGEDDASCLAALEQMGQKEEKPLEQGAAPCAAAAWHGEQGHVEQMIGALKSMARQATTGMPGALRMRDQEASVLLCARAAESFVSTMTRYLFGLDPDAANRTLCFAPHTPIGWDGWELENVAIGDAHFDMKAERVSPSHVRYTIMGTQEGWKVVLCQDAEKQELALDGVVSVVMGD